MMSYFLISRVLELRLELFILGIREVVELASFIECLLWVLYVESGRSEPKRLDSFIECLLWVLYVESARNEPKRLDFGTIY